MDLKPRKGKVLPKLTEYIGGLTGSNPGSLPPRHTLVSSPHHVLPASIFCTLQGFGIRLTFVLQLPESQLQFSFPPEPFWASLLSTQDERDERTSLSMPLLFLSLRPFKASGTVSSDINWAQQTKLHWGESVLLMLFRVDVVAPQSLHDSWILSNRLVRVCFQLKETLTTAFL